jgi:hypothetical protein
MYDELTASKLKYLFSLLHRCKMVSVCGANHPCGCAMGFFNDPFTRTAAHSYLLASKNLRTHTKRRGMISIFFVDARGHQLTKSFGELSCVKTTNRAHRHHFFSAFSWASSEYLVFQVENFCRV